MAFPDKEHFVTLKFQETEYHNFEYLGREILNSSNTLELKIPYKYCKGTIIEDCVEDTQFDFTKNKFEFTLPKKFENVDIDFIISWLNTRKSSVYVTTDSKRKNLESSLDLIDFLGLDKPTIYVGYSYSPIQSSSHGGGSSTSYRKYERDYDDYYEGHGWMSDDDYDRRPELNMTDDDEDHYSIGIDEEERLERLEMEAAYEEFRKMCIAEDSSMEE